MKVSATVRNSYNRHKVVVTNGDSMRVSTPPQSTGYGSTLNDGELLLVALATYPRIILNATDEQLKNMDYTYWRRC